MQSGDSCLCDAILPFCFLSAVLLLTVLEARSTSFHKNAVQGHLLKFTSFNNSVLIPSIPPRQTQGVMASSIPIHFELAAVRTMTGDSCTLFLTPYVTCRSSSCTATSEIMAGAAAEEEEMILATQVGGRVDQAEAAGVRSLGLTWRPSQGASWKV